MCICVTKEDTVRNLTFFHQRIKSNIMNLQRYNKFPNYCLSLGENCLTLPLIVVQICTKIILKITPTFHSYSECEQTKFMSTKKEAAETKQNETYSLFLFLNIKKKSDL